jgi:hypothetical protein
MRFVKPHIHDTNAVEPSGLGTSHRRPIIRDGSGGVGGGAAAALDLN